MGMEPKVKTLALKHITADPGIQPRAKGLNAAVVGEYAAEMEAGAEFPPVVVYRDPTTGTNWLSQGFHRLAAAEKAGLTKIAAEMRTGTRRDALIDAAGSNRHGLRRTNADKRRAVELLLKECPDWSNPKVAESAGVSIEFVRQTRPEVATVATSTRTGKDGKTYPAKGGQVSSDDTSGGEPAGDESAAGGDDETTSHAEQSNGQGDSGAENPSDEPDGDDGEQATETPAGDDGGDGDDEPAPAQMVAGPSHPADEFVGRVNRLCRALDFAKTEVSVLAADPFGRHVHAESVTLQIEAARKALWQSRPTEPCNCVRTGADPAEGCKACFGTGRTTAARVLKGGR